MRLFRHNLWASPEKVRPHCGKTYPTTISFLPDRSEKNLCKMLIAILLLLSSGSLIIVVDIGVVIPKPSDQPNPDVQMCRFRIEVKIRLITGSPGKSAEAIH